MTDFNYFRIFKKENDKTFSGRLRPSCAWQDPTQYRVERHFKRRTRHGQNELKKWKKEKRGWRNDWIRALTLSNYFFFFFVSIGSSNMRVFLYSSFRNFRRDFYFRTWTGWNRPPETKWKRRKRKRFFRLTQCWHGEEPSPPPLPSFIFLFFHSTWVDQLPDRSGPIFEMDSGGRSNRTISMSL